MKVRFFSVVYGAIGLTLIAAICSYVFGPPADPSSSTRPVAELLADLTATALFITMLIEGAVRLVSLRKTARRS